MARFPMLFFVLFILAVPVVSAAQFGVLTKLQEVEIVVSDLSNTEKELGLNKKDIENHVFVFFQSKLPRVAVKKTSKTNFRISSNIFYTTSSGRRIGFFGQVMVSVFSPVIIKRNGGHATVPVWVGSNPFAGPPTDARPVFNNAIDRMLTEFAEDWYRDNPTKYKYNVATLREYVEYKRAPNRFYEQRGAEVLSFDCERIRDDFVTMNHETIVSDEADSFGGPGKVLELYIRTRLLGAWREGTVLHMATPNIADSGAIAVLGRTFTAWKNQITELATVQHPREEGHAGTLLQALFTQVTIHGSNQDEEFTVVTRRGSKFDACGPPRE